MKSNIRRSLTLIFGTLLLNSLQSLVYAAASNAEVEEVDAKATTPPMPCPAWTTPVDKHGVYTCPPYSVKKSYWGLMECAYAQTNIFTIPTPEQQALTRALVQVIVKDKPTRMVGIAKKLNLQFCRSEKRDAKGKLLDSVLVGIPIPGYNYNGAFFLVRKRPNVAPILIEVPHNDFGSPGVMLAFENGNAEFLLKNAQRRISGPNAKCSDGPASDAAHSVYHGFYDAHAALTELRPDLIVLHFHGTTRPGMLITNGLQGNPGNDSLFYAATKIIADRYPNAPGLIACAKGTALPAFNGRCGITQAWVEVRNLTCSPDPQCKLGEQNLNRVLGFELNFPYTHSNFFIPLMQGLEEGYLKTRSKTPQLCAPPPSRSPTLHKTRSPTARHG